MKFNAITVEEVNGEFIRYIGEYLTDRLPKGEVLIKVEYSSLNYKDALSASGHKGVTKNYPHIPGIDASGIVTESISSIFKPGDKVIVTGYDLGMNTSGGFSQYVRVPAEWVVPLPNGLTVKEAMVLGTAGFTAALSLHRMEANGVCPEKGKILVTGATGGVGSAAVAILHKAGYQICAATRKTSMHGLLNSLGADEIIHTDELVQAANRPLNRGRWQGAIDTVGGTVLTGVLASLSMFGSAASCGLTQSPSFAATVYPFIIRGNNLLGINSAETPMKLRVEIWNKLSNEWKLTFPEGYYRELGLKETLNEIPQILAGEISGRTLVNPNI